MGKRRIGFWLSQEGRTLLRGWVLEGLSHKQIAENMGVSTVTFYSYKKKYPDFADCIGNKEITDHEVEIALREKAVSGNVQAAIFLLKNSDSRKWSEKPPDEGGFSVENCDGSGEGVCVLDDL